MMVTGSVYTIAKTLYEHHGFEPDVAVSAAHCYVRGRFPTASYYQAMYHLGRTKHTLELTQQDVEDIERAYLRVKVPSAQKRAGDVIGDIDDIGDVVPLIDYTAVFEEEIAQAEANGERTWLCPECQKVQCLYGHLCICCEGDDNDYREEQAMRSQLRYGG